MTEWQFGDVVSLPMLLGAVLSPPAGRYLIFGRITYDPRTGAVTNGCRYTAVDYDMEASRTWYLEGNAYRGYEQVVGRDVKAALKLRDLRLTEKNYPGYKFA